MVGLLLAQEYTREKRKSVRASTQSSLRKGDTKIYWFVNGLIQGFHIHSHIEFMIAAA